MKRRWAGAIAVAAIAFSCGKKGSSDEVSADVAPRIEECVMAAGIVFELRSMAKDYSIEEADKREEATKNELKPACTAPSKKAECCAAAKRLKARLAGNPVANCNPFFNLVAADGCADLDAPQPSTSGS